MKPIAGAAALLVSLAVGGPAAALPLVVNVQQWALCPNATVDGDCSLADIDEGYVSDIYAQADIQLSFAPAINAFTGFPFTDTGGGEVDPGDALETFGFNIDLLGREPNTAYLAYTPDLTGSTIGLAYLDEPAAPYGIVQSVGFTQQEYSVIFAHELGHILGGEHGLAVDPLDLMYPSLNADASEPGFLPDLSTANVSAMRDSALLAPAVPVPAALPLLGAAVAALALGGRRRAGRAPAAG